ncbi:MAG: carboxymuconolactone decarboxylase family protein [Stenotrophobium sp.]
MSERELEPEGGWHRLPAARLSAPKPAERGAMFRMISSLSRFKGRAQVPDIFSVFHINSRLFWGWLFFASRLMPYGKLPARDREKIILRTAWNCRSRYEWGQHVEIALRVGVSDDDIVRITQGPQAWEGRPEQMLMAACDEVFRSQCISDATWSTLAAHYDEKLLIEIVILIGHYVMVAGFLNSAGLTLEPPIEEKLRAFHQRIGVQK